MGQGHGAVDRDWTGQPVFHAGPAPSPDRPPQRAECVVSRPRQEPAGRRPGPNPRRVWAATGENLAFRAADFRKSTEKQHPCLEVLGDRQGGSVHQP